MDFALLDRTKVLAKFDEALSRGLCVGAGTQDGQMCIEAAICYALGLPHGDDPSCVTPSVRSFKINLNDSTYWSSPASRAKHLRALGIAQIGSKGVVNSFEFSRRLAEKTIRVLIPALFRQVLPGKFVDLVNACEATGSENDARELANASASTASFASTASSTAAAAAVHYASANAAHYAAHGAGTVAASASKAAATAAHYTTIGAATNAEHFLILSANLALEVLKELKSPGCEWLEMEAK